MNINKAKKSNGLGISTAVLTISKVITLIIGMVTSMLLSRFRTLDEYGTYSAIMLVTQLATAFFAIGLPNSTNYFIARSDTSESRRQFLSVFYSILTVLCIIMGLILIIVIPGIESYFHNDNISKYAFFLGFHPWACVVISTVSNVLVAYGKTVKLMLFNIINAAISLTSVIVTKIFNWSFIEYMIVFLCGEIMMMVWVYIIVCKLEHPLRPSFHKRTIINLFKYSVPIGLAAIVGTISIEIDKLMIGSLFDTEQLAIYSNAAKELPFTIVASSLTAILLPQFVRMIKHNKVQQAIELWGNSILFSYSIICFFAMGLFVFAPQAISFLYSDKYLPGVSIFRAYALHLLLRCTYFGIVLNSIGKTKFIFYSSLVSLALNALLNYLLYLLFGIVGPAIATVLSLGIVGIGQLLATSKAINIPMAKLMPWSGLIKISCINLLLGIILNMISGMLGLETSLKDIINSIIIVLVAAIIYCIVMYRPLKKLWEELNRVEVTVNE